MQALGYVLLARILFATLVLDQISSQAIERRVETVDLTEARQSLTRTTVELKALPGTTESNGIAAFAGARYGIFLTSNLFVGGGGYAGRLFGSGAGAGSVGFGGLFFGAELPLTAGLSIEASSLFGGGGANYHSASAGATMSSSFVIEPSMSVLAKFGKGVRVGGQISYVSFSNIPQISGWSASVVVDLRRFNLSVPE
jgi:hypothetical protein